MISPDELTATRIFNEGRSLPLRPGRLHIRRWSRFCSSAAEDFSVPVDVELRGIPAHAWDLETVSQLLSDCCVPCDVHPETAVQREVFRVTTWSSTPWCIPPVIDLVIPEPEVDGRHDPLARHTLVYPVRIAASALGGNVSAGAAPPPPPSSDDADRHVRHQHRRWVRRPAAAAPASMAEGGEPRASVLSRLGGPVNAVLTTSRGDVSSASHYIDRHVPGATPCVHTDEAAAAAVINVSPRTPSVAAPPVPQATLAPSTSVDPAPAALDAGPTTCCIPITKVVGGDDPCDLPCGGGGDISGA